MRPYRRITAGLALSALLVAGCTATGPTDPTGTTQTTVSTGVTTTTVTPDEGVVMALTEIPQLCSPKFPT